MRNIVKFWLPSLSVMLLLPVLAHAAMTIEIIGGAASKLPVAIAPFVGAGDAYRTITDVVAADLARTGELSLVDVADLNPPLTDPADPRFSIVRKRGAEAAVLGQVSVLANGQIEVRFRLMDAVKQTQMAGYSYTTSATQLRMVGHKIADVVYEKLMGVPGIFSTHIAYVIKQGKRYELQVADADGQGVQTVLKSTEPLISPAWSPDGSKLAYVSFEAKKPVIYVQNMMTGTRRILANFKGSNSAPAWSPDGSKLALVLTRDDGSQLYLINADGTGLKRLTFGGGIDTEPDWSPDGQSLLFTSDRGGSPQIYQISVAGGSAKRMTYDGNYNVSPTWAPDGKRFAFVQRSEGRFRIAVQDISSGQIQVLTNTNLDESPSFAANGKMIVYATEINGRGVLSAVSSDGKTQVRLSDRAGDMREPDWGH
ncbi:Tol-Pal system beta propeller repeat protein TolB [Sulfuriferula thiophila]|uniref:Tol-Pal system beta propeller repeat protein TolB n=1 Tax=Sulfuriferula thiophila TaxID=1781211 RepID=UPI000F60E599|nr:Tol-Pal system beta propeller repeat protein TolB [Sulfuriferula thiophila]